VTAVNPVWLWVVLTVASIAVGGAMLWIAFAVVNKRERERHGFEVKPTERKDSDVTEVRGG
jgi:hypothetical protein